MNYFQGFYFLAMLPAVLVIYHLVPKKHRWWVLLAASFGFYVMNCWSLFYIMIAAAAITWAAGLAQAWLMHRCDLAVAAVDPELDKKAARAAKAAIKKRFLIRRRVVLVIGILLDLSMLLLLKYHDFFAENINAVMDRLGSGPHLMLRYFVLPLGISFYTMQAIGYMVDVYWGKIPAQKNPAKMLLFMCFFPTVVEGPMAPYKEVHESLFAGESLTYDRLIRSYLRIFWGIFKKLVIADRLYTAVAQIFDNFDQYNGAYVVLGMVAFTLQEYLEFSGAMDVVIGSAGLFGVKLPENFRQPFFAKNASEFWRRWHMSLGVWFRTYIFYPVSMSGLAKKLNKTGPKRIGKYGTKLVISAMALFPVWLCNGLWHGPRWTYIMYGMYYFAVILVEQALEPAGKMLWQRFHVAEDARGLTVFRVLRTWVVIFLGELLFRAYTLAIGWHMFRRMLMPTSVAEEMIAASGGQSGFMTLGLQPLDWTLILIGMAVVILVGILREKHPDLSGWIVLERPAALRFILAFALVMVIALLGRYGPGFTEVDMIYAGF